MDISRVDRISRHNFPKDNFPPPSSAGPQLQALDRSAGPEEKTSGSE